MRRRLPWLVWALTVILIVPGLVSMATHWWALSTVLYLVAFAFLGLGAATMGALVTSRIRGNAIGWILLAVGAGIGAILGSWGYTELSLVSSTGPLPGFRYVAWVGTWLTTPVLFGLSSSLLLLFPNGRLLSRRWRWVGGFVAVSITLATVAQALLPGPLDPGGFANPMAPGGTAGEFIRWLYAVSDWLAPPVLLSVAAALIVRLRRSRGVERQQLKWFTYVATIACLSLAAGVAGPSQIADGFFLAGLLALAGLPIATGLAILRYRLYAIDVVINRTLVYGLLTVTLGAAYLGSILLLQLALSPLTKESGLAIAASTLAVAAMFRPARARIQALVDRRFYRHRYDAAQTLDEFGQRLRHELDLETLATDLQTVVHDTMQPTHASLWLRRADR